MSDQIVMNGEPGTDLAIDPSQCRHEVRLRESPSGFASPETRCVECGERFDPDEEQQLRHRDQAAQRSDIRQVSAREGYIVG